MLEVSRKPHDYTVNYYSAPGTLAVPGVSTFPDSGVLPHWQVHAPPDTVAKLHALHLQLKLAGEGHALLALLDNPLIKRSKVLASVDLPQPDGPTSTMNSLSLMSILTS